MSHIDKKTNSTAYRRKIKKLTEMMKSYRQLRKIPGQPGKLKASASARERAIFNDLNCRRIDRSTIRYFCSVLEGGSDRRSQATVVVPETQTAA